MSDQKIKTMLLAFLGIIFIAIVVTIIIIQNRRELEELNELYRPISSNYYYSDIYKFQEFRNVYANVFNYYALLKENNSDVLQLLSSIYISKNQITSQNVRNYVETVYEQYNYQIKYIQKYKNDYYSFYYIEGVYSSEGLDETLATQNVTDILIFDYVNNTFAVVPLLEKITFEEFVEKYGLNAYDTEIKTNSKNGLRNIQTSDYDEAMFYFSEYTWLLKENCEEAWKYLSDDSLKKYPTYQNFLGVCKLYEDENSSFTIKHYVIDTTGDQRKIKVVDSNGNPYTFILSHVLNYKVDLN